MDGVPIEQIRDELGYLTVKIAEQNYAQIHPEYREKAREYNKQAYASNVTVLRWQNQIKSLIYWLFWGTLSTNNSAIYQYLKSILETI